MDEIKDLLDLHQWKDLQLLQDRLLAKARPDVARLAHEITIYSPVEPAKVSEIVKSVPNVHLASINRLYSMCNGLRIGATKFGVYGFLTSGRSSPLDLNDPNYYEKPFELLSGDIILGYSRCRKNDLVIDCFHLLDASGNILVLLDGRIEPVLRKHDSIDSWLRFEVAAALKDGANF